MPWCRVRSLPLNFLRDPQHAPQHNPTYSFSSSSLSTSWLPVLFYSPTSTGHTTFFSSHPSATLLFPRALNTHTCSFAHSLIQSHSLRNPDADTDTRNVSAAISGAMGRAGPREVALVYSPASLACIFIMALLWAPRRGSGPASSHSFALHQDSRIISPLTVAGCSCPTPSPVNGAQLSLLSLPPSHPASECSSP